MFGPTWLAPSENWPHSEALGNFAVGRQKSRYGKPKEDRKVQCLFKTVITLYTITDDLIYPVGGQDTNYTWGHVSTTALSFDWAWNLVAEAVELKLYGTRIFTLIL